MSLYISFKIKLVLQWLRLWHMSHLKLFFVTHLHTQACMTVVSIVTLNFVDCTSVFAFWVLKSQQLAVHDTKILSEYDQEIPQSQTADYPAQPSQDTRKTN